MKEVKYNGDLIADIDTLNSKNNSLKAAVISLGGSLGAFIIALEIAFNCGVGFAPEMMLPAAGTIFGTSGLLSATAAFISNRKYKKRFRKSKHNIVGLQQELKGKDVILDRDAIKDAEIIEEVTKSTTKNDEGRVISKAEKIVRFLYLLDSEDQIKVLRLINESTKEYKATSTSTTLELMEENDLQGVELPVQKKLIRK